MPTTIDEYAADEVTTGYDSETDPFVEEEYEFEGYTPSRLPENEKIPFFIQDFQKTTTRNGKEMWKMKLVCFDEEFKNKTIFHQISLADAARPFRFEFLKAVFGLADGEIRKFKSSDVNGRVVEATIRYEEYEGNINERVKKFYAPSQAALELSEETDVPH